MEPLKLRLLLEKALQPSTGGLTGGPTPSFLALEPKGGSERQKTPALHNMLDGLIICAAFAEQCLPKARLATACSRLSLNPVCTRCGSKHMLNLWGATYTWELGTVAPGQTALSPDIPDN